MAPCSPPHKREATKTFSTMAGVGVKFCPECTSRRKAGIAGLHRQHRHVGAGEWQGPLGEGRRQARLRPKELSGPEVLVNRYPSPKAGFSVCMGVEVGGGHQSVSLTLLKYSETALCFNLKREKIKIQ